ncbi:MAG: hypothetical protein RBU37_15705 [Myxococcota bacterium]|nr:hypothetical protein [Myxococcota bacterium]
MSASASPLHGAPPNASLWALLSGKLRLLRNLPRSTAEGSRGRLLAFLLMGTAVWAGLFGASLWFFRKTLALEPFGEILLSKLLGLTFLVIFAVLVFSSVIAAFSIFLLSDELSFLVVRPIRPHILYSARFIETTVYSSWMVILFGLAVFLAAGIAASAPWNYYAVLSAALLPFSLIPPALAVLVVLLLANLMPVHRTKELLIGLGVLAFVAAFILFRSLQPERLLRPSSFGSTMEFFSTLKAPGDYWLPSSWLSELVLPRLWGQDGPLDWLHVACLLSTAVGLFFIGAWTFRWLFSRAYSRALQGRSGTMGEASQKRAARRLQRWLQAQANASGRLGSMRAIAAKDALILMRDTVQWSQLLMLAALIVIYLVNFRYVGAIGRGGVLGPMGLHFLNLALCGFLVGAVSVRMVFPAVSLEGRAFWLIKRAPLGMHRYLVAKALGHITPLLVLALSLTLSSNWMIGSSTLITLKSMALIALLVLALTGLGVGMGAIFPRFHVDDVTKIATGLGGILFMLSSILVLVAVIVLDAYSTYHFLRLEMGFARAFPSDFWYKASLSWAGLLLLTVGGAALALHLGARRLARSFR